jgi:hypothetical protein
MRKQVLAVTIGVLLVLSVFSVLQFWQIKPVQATTYYTFGNTAVPSIYAYIPTSLDNMKGSNFTLTDDNAILNSLSAWMDGNGSTTNVKLLVYNVSAYPDALVATSAVVAVSGAESSPTLYNFSVSATLSAGVYWLIIVAGGGCNTYQTSSSWISDIVDYASGNYATPPNPFPLSASQGTYEFSIYANYTLTLPALSVTLNTPTSGSSSTNQSINFAFTPVTYGSAIQNATLYTNVTTVWAATQTNVTAVVNNTLDAIVYAGWSSFNTIEWNILIWNTTVSVFASANYTLTIVSSLPSLSVSLITPNSGIFGNATINFVYTPVTYGSAIQNTSVCTNITGSWVETQGNTSTVTNNAQNTISYSVWPSYGTFVWNIQVYNTTANVFAVANYTFTITSGLPYNYSWVGNSQWRGVFMVPDANFIAVNNWTTIASTLAGYGVNFVVIDVISNYQTAYTSAYVPCRLSPALDFSNILTIFHAQNISVYANFGTMYGSYSGDGKYRGAYYLPGNLTPTDYYSGHWLDICNENSTSLVKALIEELVGNYSIEGISFDYTRWDDFMPVNPDAFTQFKTDTGLDTGVSYTQWIEDVAPPSYGGNELYYIQFLKWRTAVINTWVKNMTQWALAINPNLTFGCTPHSIYVNMPDYWTVQQGQDAAYWIKEGYIQFVMPMEYPASGSSGDIAAFIAALPSHVQAWQTYTLGGSKGIVALVPCITYGGSSFGYNFTVSEFVSSVNAASGADGWMIYEYPGTSGTGTTPDIKPYLGNLSLPQTFALTNVAVQALSSSSEQISWTTSSAANSTVEYSSTPLFAWTQPNATDWTYLGDGFSEGYPYWQNTHNVGSLVTSSAATTNHVTITGVTTGTTYYCRILSTDISGTAFTTQFTFATSGGNESTVVVSINYPLNTTYSSGSPVPLDFGATGGTIDKMGWNCTYNNGTIAYTNQTYTTATTMTLTYGTYILKCWANNTINNVGVATIVFSVSAGGITQIIVNVWWSFYW